MQRPTTIRIMLMILYLKLVLLLMNVGTIVFNPGSLNEIDEAQRSTFITAITILTTVSIACIAGMILTINKKKYWPTLLIAFVLLICSTMMNQLHSMMTTLIIVMFLFRSSREYFRGVYVAPPSPRAKAAATAKSESTEDEESEQAALAEPDEAPAAPLVKLKKEPEVTIRAATPQDANTVFSLMIMAFEEYRSAIPPSSALAETEESVEEALRSGSESAVLLYEDDTAVAMARFKYENEAICFFRLSVVPHRRRRGYARQLVKWIEKEGVGNGKTISRCKVRQSVQNNLVLYQNMDYEIVDQELIVRPEGTVKALTMEKKLWE